MLVITNFVIIHLLNGKFMEEKIAYLTNTTIIEMQKLQAQKNVNAVEFSFVL